MSSSRVHAPRRPLGLAAGAAALAAFAMALVAGPVLAAGDLAALAVVPRKGQSAEQARRDRYECHNWAIGQTGVVPARADGEEDRAAAQAARVNRTLTGAAAGSAIGGFVRAVQNENPAHGLLAGAALGATVGAFTGRKPAADTPDPEFTEYVRALSACLEGRGYSVEQPDTGSQ